MKINSTKILRGANYWSIQVPLLLQVGITIHSSINVDSVIGKVKEHFPEILIDPKQEKNLQLAQLVAQTAVQLQLKAGVQVAFYLAQKTVRLHDYIVVFEYKTEAVAELVIEKTVAFIFSLINNKPVDVEAIIATIQKAYNHSLAPAPLLSLLEQAKTARVPVILSKNALPCQFGYGKFGIPYSTENQEIINELFQSATKGRIPIIAVTGSNGKTTTTRLIAFVLGQMGHSVGFTTSDGIYVKNKMIDSGDTTGPASAAMVLRHPEVDIAVLETARGGIVRAGIGFDQCDIAVITNIQEDHLGISDIETIEDLAKVKAVIVGAVGPDGRAVLNANNPHTTAIGQKAASKVAWFSVNKDTPFFRNLLTDRSSHLAFIENHHIVIQKEGKKEVVCDVNDIPITYNGTAHFMVENVLAATLALSVYGIAPNEMAKPFKQFIPSVEQTPGRMNLFDIHDKKLLVDFAHNPDGFAGIRDFLANIKSPQKIGIIVGTGDRKDSDTIALGQIAAQMFDVVLIHQVKFLRGQSAERIVELLVQGITTENPNATWERIPDEEEPLQYALAMAKPHAYITALSDVIDHPAQWVAQYVQSAN